MAIRPVVAPRATITVQNLGMSWVALSAKPHSLMVRSVSIKNVSRDCETSLALAHKMPPFQYSLRSVLGVPPLNTNVGAKNSQSFKPFGILPREDSWKESGKRA